MIESNILNTTVRLFGVHRSDVEIVIMRARLQGMMETSERRRNGALWLGLLLAVLGPLGNGLTFVGFPAGTVPWISLVLPVMGVGLVFFGSWRAFKQSAIYKGKISSTVLAVLSVLLLVLSVAFFWGARHIPPRSAGAPALGQHVPDFTLPDSSGKSVSLTQLFDSSSGMRA